ncbi:cell wall anchor protein [Chryseobacterium lactis]|uniref:Cell wall anchor protein n=1 Tax=Chryseobacterium lactis TaxID=1241981 RepID=A0A3G6RTI2_CHRLC|nr:cell wall anchor protein [Chryseobacterium lactis]AZA84797.1 cell wall anchor protein [Chryseobacterium lactis]AZB05186.1 cell wall anchor protein [Chryseobacterium lactis]PNW12168.1 cell wall anchor protein [Chryseobacterium lactis]
MIELFKEHIGTFLSLVVSGSAGWFFGRRKLNAEVEGMDADNEGKKLENDEKLVNLYKEALDDLGNRYESKFKEFSEISERKIKLLEEEINIQKRINEQLRAENAVLKAKLKEN